MIATLDKTSIVYKTVVSSKDSPGSSHVNAEALSPVEDLVQRPAVHHVRLDRNDLAVGEAILLLESGALIGDLGELLLPPRQEDDVRAATREELSGRRADTAGRAGDQD